MNVAALMLELVGAGVLSMGGAWLLRIGLAGLRPHRGKRRAPKERLPRLTSPAQRPSTEDDTDPPARRQPLTDQEHAEFWNVVHDNPVLSSRLTQLWAGIEVEEEPAS